MKTPKTGEVSYVTMGGVADITLSEAASHEYALITAVNTADK